MKQVASLNRFSVSTSKKSSANFEFCFGKRVDFVADPSTRQIFVLSADGRSSFVLFTAETDDEFWSLRPCVSVAGRVDVCVLSDPDGV
jgi:hypothetical protein